MFLYSLLTLLFFLSVNIDNTVGAVGFTTRIAPMLYPVTLIKVDKDTGEPVRDRNGVCIQCGPGRDLSKSIFC